jgi:DNA-binding NtrC family response regulator
MFHFEELEKMLFCPPATSEPTKSVLIVDDDQMIIELLALVFEKFGLKVFNAKNSFDAWNLYNNEKIDLVLTDIQIPTMDGKELSRRIRNNSAHTKIAVMTGGESDKATELLKDGTVDFFFPKFFNVDNICRILQQKFGLTNHLRL